MQQPVRDSYERLGDEHWWFQGRRRILARVLQSWLREAPTDGRILDLGPGYGVNSGVLAEMVQRVALNGEAPRAALKDTAKRIEAIMKS